MRACVDCGVDLPYCVWVDGKKRKLTNRTRCLACLPFGTSPLSVRYATTGSISGRTKAAIKSAKWRQRVMAETGEDPISVFRKARKRQIVNIIGGCQICKYSRLISNLAFHHMKNKQLSLSERDFQRSWDKLTPEIRKCILICNNCHGEVHAGMHLEVLDRKLAEVNLAVDKLLRDIAEDNAPTHGPPCKVCGRLCKTSNNQYCGSDCWHKAQQKADWPPDEEFLKLIQDTSMRRVARSLRVSDQAVAKHLRKVSRSNPISQ